MKEQDRDGSFRLAANQKAAKVSSKKHQRRRHPGFGIMKGLTTIAPEVDLTEPAFPELADLIDEKYGKEA